MKSSHYLLFATLAAAVLTLTGCGKNDKTDTASTTATANVEEIRVVKITADDTMKYSVTEVHAKAGEKLQISFANVGHLPKQVMAHNWVLVKPMADAELNAFAMAAASKVPNYLPDDMSVVLAHTKLLGAGESDRIEINAPTVPGEYRFLCTFPGHFVMMKGKLIVS